MCKSFYYSLSFSKIHTHCVRAETEEEKEKEEDNKKNPSNLRRLKRHHLLSVYWMMIWRAGNRETTRSNSALDSRVLSFSSLLHPYRGVHRRKRFRFLCLLFYRWEPEIGSREGKKRGLRFPVDAASKTGAGVYSASLWPLQVASTSIIKSLIEMCQSVLP